MGQVLFVVWRESVEALLVVGILYAWLKNGDMSARRSLPFLWAGVGVGVLAAVALGAALVGFSEFLSGDAADYFQTGMVLVACVLIVQMVLWMKRHGRTLKRDMERSLQTHTRDGNGWGIAILVALAIAREGSETVIFLYGLGFGQSGHVGGADVLAIVLGLALAFLTFYCLQLWNTSALIDDSSTVGSLVAALTGYRAHPSLTNLVAYVLYWAVVGWLARRASRMPATTAGRPV